MSSVHNLVRDVYRADFQPVPHNRSCPCRQIIWNFLSLPDHQEDFPQRRPYLSFLQRDIPVHASPLSADRSQEMPQGHCLNNLKNPCLFPPSSHLIQMRCRYISPCICLQLHHAKRQPALSFRLPQGKYLKPDILRYQPQYYPQKCIT